MKRNVNWSLWLGLLLSIAAFVSYFTFFALYPITRDIPWASLLLFAAAVILLVQGARRAFAQPSSTARKVVASVVTTAGIGIAGIFLFVITVGSKDLPPAHGAPVVGSRAPDFTLAGTNRKPVTLSQVLTTPGTNGALLIFYRGYW